jgi:hypothetical protein
MKLYHLNWDATRSYSRDLLIAIISPIAEPGSDVLEQGQKTYDALKEAFDLGFYKHVADIDTEDQNYAYRHSQHIDNSWTDNPAEGINIIESEQVRSTSIGDILTSSPP